MKKWGVIVILLVLGRIGLVSAKSGIELSGDILEYAMPAAALTSTFIWKDDTHPTWQFVKSYGSAIVVCRILKVTIDKERPDGGVHSFPSGHTTSAFASAAFMERRYGWKVGIPAYVMAGYVGWSRVYAERHDWWDVLGGAVLGTTASYIFTKAYKRDDLSLSFNVAPQNYQFGLVYNF